MADVNRQILLAEKPQGALEAGHFEMREVPLPSLSDGEVLVRSRYLSIDAANRAWMQGRTYRGEVGAGTVMAGGVLGEVEASEHPSFSKGDLVWGDLGWQEYAAAQAKDLEKLPKMEPVTHLLSVYGITGLTAYFGLLEIGKPQEGETVVVSAAAGAVGSVVCQIAKLKGARVVGIAGSDEKCQRLTDELGCDEAVNYKSGPVFKSLKSACPDGIDVYFDNVGGDILEAALFQMNLHGRIPCCGAVSQYDGAPPAHGPRGIPGLLVTQRITMRGFIVMDFFAKRDEALADLQNWVGDGKIIVKEDVVEGLENAPHALVGLLHGDNVGKRLVKIS